MVPQRLQCPTACTYGRTSLDDAAFLAQRPDDRRARLEPVQALERTGDGDHAVLVHDGQAGQVVPAADLEVVRVVRGGHLDRAGAERRVDVLVGHDRDAAAGQRQLDGLADQVLVPARRPGARRRRCRRASSRPGWWPRRSLFVAITVADRDELALVVGVVHLDVGQGGQAARAPVDDPLGAVDQVVVVQPLEDRLHGAGQPLVHGEPLARPVHAVAEAAHLGQDLAAVLGLPLPHPLDERLAAQVVAGQALLGELPLDDVLGGDARVVHAGQPQRAVALHAAAPGQGVHQRVVERVADVQRTRYVRRRQHDAEARRGGILLGFRREVARLLPVLVTAGLHLGRRVLRGEPFWFACGHT